MNLVEIELALQEQADWYSDPKTGSAWSKLCKNPERVARTMELNAMKTTAASEVIVAVHSVGSLSRVERAQLSALTLGERSGSMSGELARAPLSAWTVIARSGDVIIGWALVFSQYGNWRLQLFVAPEFRNMGIATRLAMGAVSEWPNTKFFVTADSDDNARLFYGRLRAMFEIDDRWSGRTKATRTKEFGWRE